MSTALSSCALVWQQPMTFATGHVVKSKSLRPSTTAPCAQSATVCSVKRHSDLPAIGSATAVSTSVFVLRASFAKSVALKSHVQKCAASAWAISNLLHQSCTFGTYAVPVHGLHTSWAASSHAKKLRQSNLRRSFTSQPGWFRASTSTSATPSFQNLKKNRLKIAIN